jgi:hypothetical protein
VIELKHSLFSIESEIPTDWLLPVDTIYNDLPETRRFHGASQRVWLPISGSLYSALVTWSDLKGPMHCQLEGPLRPSPSEESIECNYCWNSLG